MVIYLDLVILLNFVVDLLLLTATAKLSGFPVRLPAILMASGIGSVYAAVCTLLPTAGLSSAPVWCGVLFAMCGICFGWKGSALRCAALFLLLSFALCGLTMSFSRSNIGAILLPAAAMVGACYLVLPHGCGAQQLVHVTLRNGQQQRSFFALRDTGNTLKDPLTGRSVMVLGAALSQQLTGFSRHILSDPVAAMAEGKITGLRLIPYRSVGQPNGMLLCAKMDELRINGEISDMLVAFAAEDIGKNAGYEALTGGIL